MHKSDELRTGDVKTDTGFIKQNYNVKIKKFVAAQLYVLFILIFLGLLLIYIQSKYKIVELEPLAGAYQMTEPAKFSYEDWFSCDYQTQFEKHLSENFGFRNFFIRLYNQVSYDLFRIVKANEIIVGKEDYLFERNYIEAYCGKDFIGADSIRNNMERLKYLQEYFEKNNKTLLLIFEPGKASFYPEYIPDRYLEDLKPRNYECFIETCNQIGIEHIDFNGYFTSLKKESKYMLYPKYGIHWSRYGMCLALDSIVHWLEMKRNVNLINPYWDSIKIEPPSHIDSDIAVAMNLLWKPRADPMGYPELTFKDQEVAVRPSVIVVGDSFYWDMLSFTPNIFSKNHHFWYYNTEVYPKSSEKAIQVDKLDLAQEIRDHDIFIIMCTESNYSKLGWRFIENAYNLIKHGIPPGIPNFKKKVEETMNYIRSDKNWMDVIIKKAKKENISVDTMLLRDAIWIVRSKG